MIYAQIDEQNICVAISKLKKPAIKPNLIEINFFDTGLLGLIWTGSEWIQPPKPE